MAKRFDGKVVWITGGGSGIGQALAVEFARQGARVAVSGRRREKLLDSVRLIEAEGAEARAVECDVTEETSVQAAVEEVVDAFGGLDVAVANAGFAVAGPVASLSADDWRRQLDTNVVGAAVTVRHALPHLAQRKGRIALVGSISALIATPGMGAYTASKYAVRAIGQTLSLELHGTGVSCTVIQPGFVESDIARVDNQGTHHPDREDRRPKQLMWPADKAARTVVAAIYRRRREFIFTGHGKVGAFVGKHFPGFGHFVITRATNPQKMAKQLSEGK